MKLAKNIQQSRHRRLQQISQRNGWDIIIIGGGITGAGILKLASQMGLKALLLEQKDFAWGSSSRSSKMVHGGLRYIAEGQIGLTRESVRERQRLLKDAQGLVIKQSFTVSHYARKFPWPWVFNLLLSIYDLFSGKRQHRYWSKKDYQYLVPGTDPQDSTGGTQFMDAMTDDARLVLRLIQEAQQNGSQAVNYSKVNQLIRENGKVVGVLATPEESEDAIRLDSKVVVNATGAWSSLLLSDSEKQVLIRPLRGSHLVVPSWRLPVASAISVAHPFDKRPVQIFPWQNVTIIGTTDVEHQQSLSFEPCISQDELNYLMECVEHQFPFAQLTEKDIISTFAGVRPVIDSGTATAPSKEKRDHTIWTKPGLINVAGGKLTTFHVIAKQVINLMVKNNKKACPELSNVNDFPSFDSCDLERFNLNIEQMAHLKNYNLSENLKQHIIAYYGQLSCEFVNQSCVSHLKPIGYSANLWAELVWAVKYEQVQHLDDLLLRRTRIGIVLPDGGLGEIEPIKQLCFKFLHWSEQQWAIEIEDYRLLWQRSYSLPRRNIND